MVFKKDLSLQYQIPFVIDSIQYYTQRKKKFIQLCVPVHIVHMI